MITEIMEGVGVDIVKVRKARVTWCGHVIERHEEDTIRDILK